MKTRTFHWDWEQGAPHEEHLTPEEVAHMFHLFHSTRWDGHRIFFIEKLGTHVYRVTHVLGVSAIVSWAVEPTVPAVPATPNHEECFA